MRGGCAAAPLLFWAACSDVRVSSRALPRNHYPAGAAVAALPGKPPGSASGRRALTHNADNKGALFGHRGRHQGAAGGRRPFRPPDAPMEPQDAPLHLRRARRDPHHRPPEDRAAAEARRRTSPASSPDAAGPSSSWGRRSRPATPSRRPPPPAGCRTWTSAGWAGCSPTSRRSRSASGGSTSCATGPRAARWSCYPCASASPPCPSATSSRSTSAEWPTCSARRTPMFVVDMKSEEIGVREAMRLKIPIIGLVDTNCSPDPVDYVIPGNDDAIRSCKVIIEAIASVAAEQRGAVPRPGGAGPPRARGGGASRGARRQARARPRRPSAARRRSAPAARPRRPASRPTSPPRRPPPGPPRASGAPSTLTRRPEVSESRSRPRT